MAKKRVSTKPAKSASSKPQLETDSYLHPTADSPSRPDVGTQANFKKKKSPATYRYDSSLSPALDFDSNNPAREQGEQLIASILNAANLDDAKAAASKLKAFSQPFLNWTGKAERLSFGVPTLPLFVHERLSTQAIIDTLTGHKKDQQLALFSDPQRSIADQVLKAYEHRDKWVNRMILGDSLVVMNSLLHYESLGGQVQMIYMDPPYGIKFGSNFQPFVRKRDVSHNDDDDMTREPEMVQAYRDTWELGLHSYLTYLRDRLTLARDLLTPSGSIFVQISDENVHHVRELMDEVFGPTNFIRQIAFVKTSGATSDFLPRTTDYLLWFCRDVDRAKFRPIYVEKTAGGRGGSGYTRIELPDGRRRGMTSDERSGRVPLPEKSRVYCLDNITSQSMGREKGEGAACWFPVTIDGREFRPNARSRWKTNESGMARLLAAKRVEASGNRIGYVRYFDDFPYFPVTELWDDVMPSFMSDKLYVVQTAQQVVQRCIHMTTDAGDLVLDPTCGSGTTAYVSEQWGRRWITADVSRVPLALARQRLLTATFDWYELREEARGPAGGFVFRDANTTRNGKVIGPGIVPHVTLKSIASNEPPDEDVLVDRPERVGSITRVCGPFAFEATIPTAADLNGDGAIDESEAEQHAAYEDRMLEVLRKSPVLHVDGNRQVRFRNIRKPARSLSLSAEALVDGKMDGQTLTPEDAVRISMERDGHALPFSEKPVAFVFGPENGAVSERSVYQAAMEAHAKGYGHLYVIGFEIQPNARVLVENCQNVCEIPATFVKATLDLLMGDLLKNMRSSQVFSVCGLPEIELRKAKDGKLQVELLGLDVFDPVTMQNQPRKGNDVPAWFLDTDYNGLCFHVCQAFFPRTGAWESLKKALKGTHDEAVWDHLAGTTSAPFEPGDHKQIAVKVVDDRGNELMVVKPV